MKNTASKILAAIFLFGLLLRVGWGLRQPRDLAGLEALPDQVEYLSLGQNLLEHHTLFFYDRRFDQSVYAYRMPGYPIFIALCGGSPLVVRIAQAIIDAGNVFAAYLLARRFLSQRNALLAAMLVAVNPFLIYFSGLILSETLCTAMIVWGAWLCASRLIPSPGTPGEGKSGGMTEIGATDKGQGTRDRPPTPALPRSTRGGRQFLGVLLLAISVLVRPSGLLLPVILPTIARVKRLTIVLGLSALILMLFLWAWRNEAILGKWVWATTNAGITQYDGFNPTATGASDQQFVQQMPYLQQLDEIGRNNYLAALARNFMRDHPKRIFSLAIRKLGRTFSPVPLSEQFGRPIYLAIAAAYSVPVFLLALVGIFRGPGGAKIKWLLLSVPIYFAFVHALSIGSLRYRLPAEPFIAILAATALGGKVEARSQKPEARSQKISRIFLASGFWLLASISL